jgi:hypothetical protein
LVIQEGKTSPSGENISPEITAFAEAIVKRRILQAA